MSRDRRPPWLAAAVERLRQSLFFVPALCLLAAVVLAVVTLAVDRRLTDDVLPTWLTSSVDDGRALLAAIAAGAITVASVVFSLMLVAVQMASQQFSPRNVRNFLGDRAQQLVLGVVVGTFAYSILVLRSAGAASDATVAPPVSTLSALVLAVVALLLSVLFALDRTARGLRVGEIADGIVAELVVTLESSRPERRTGGDDAGEGEEMRGGAGTGASAVERVEAVSRGWVQLIDEERLAAALPEGSTAVLAVAVGDHVWPGRLVVEVDRSLGDDARAAVWGAVVVGASRTMQQDVAFGFERLSDIALRALSPGINDPHTAEEVLRRLAGVLVTALERRPPAPVLWRDGRSVVRHRPMDDAAVVRSALAEIRVAAIRQPRVTATLIEVVGDVIATLDRRGIEAGRGELAHQARLAAREAEVPASARPWIDAALSTVEELSGARR